MFKDPTEFQELVNKDLSKLEELFRRENIDDTKLKFDLQDLVQICKGQALNYGNILSKMSTMLTKNIRPFCLQEFFELERSAASKSELVKDKRIILFLGTTGAGKSTTI